jgi:hypothetical protein
MGVVRPAAPVQPIAGLLAASPTLLAAARDALAAAVALVELASAALRWTQSDYYRAEMGAEIWRQYLALDALMAPDALADLKRLTNRLEDRWRSERGRATRRSRLPDLLRVVLASTKDAAHRVAIAADLTPRRPCISSTAVLPRGPTPTRFGGDDASTLHPRALARRARVEGPYLGW